MKSGGASRHAWRAVSRPLARFAVRIGILSLTCGLWALAASAGDEKPSKVDQRSPPRGDGQAAAKSPEEAEWEKLLEENLGSYYLPRYKKAKAEGEETAWDYVKDDPQLPRVLLIGDSISRGYTVPVRHALKGKTNVHRIPCISTKASRTPKRLPVWLGKARWDVIHFNSGIHDRKTAPAKYAEEIEAIMTALEKTGAKLIWASTTPAPERGDYAGDAAIVKLNEVAAGIMQKHKIPINDLYGFVKPRQAEWQIPDDCHFKEEKYREIGANVAEVIAAALPQRK